jgi:hypothetical protein
MKAHLKTLEESVARFAANVYKYPVTPQNIANFEEAFNNFMARASVGLKGGYTFKLRFSCKAENKLAIEEILGYNKAGERVM